MPEDLTLPVAEAPEDSTTVLIVDDNVIVRKGLRSLLETSDLIDVVGEASDGIQAESMVRALRPEVVLLDVRMPRRDGVQTVAEIADLTTVIMLTFTDEPESIRRAVAGGASGYLVHGTFDADSLVQTIRGSVLGGGVFSRQALAALRAGSAPQPDPEEQSRRRRVEFGLSERQAEIMDMIARGLSNADIARVCFLSEKTVKNHINGIFGKLVVTNRGEAIATWLGTTREP